MVKKNKEIIIKENGFVLRPYRKDDCLSIAENENNKKIARNFPDTFPSPYTKKDARKLIAQNLKWYKEGIFLNFVIDIDGRAVGAIGSSMIKNTPFMISFGFWLGEKYWGKGIITKAIKVYTGYIFSTFKNIQRIEASVYPWNEGSKKVLIKNGFKLEGVLRKSVKKDGKIIDKYMFSKLRNEK